MLCPLCRAETAELHPASHIVPEWMYTDLYSDRHKLLSFDLKKMRPEKLQKGVRASIVCNDCEGRFAKDDHYGSLVLTSRSPQAPEHRKINVHKTVGGPLRDGRMVTLEHWSGLDFKKFQNFIFSVGIRAHLAAQAELPNELYERLRRLYLSSMIDAAMYPIRICRIQEGNMHLPFLDERDGHTAISFAATGFYFLTFASEEPKPDYFRETCLRPEGSALLMQMDYFETGVFKGSLPKIGEIHKIHGQKIDKWFPDPE